jgi:hypothetical protein
MNVDEIAHAFGKVADGAPVGDLDLAPGPVGIEKDEQVGGAVAAILAVVTLKLARRSRDGLTHVIDQRGRALVEANHRSLGIGISA